MTQTGKRIPGAVLSVALNFVFWAVAVGLAIGIPAGIASTLGSDTGLGLHATVPADLLDELPGDGRVVRVVVSLPMSELSVLQNVLFHGMVALAGIAFLFALWQLREVVYSVRNGDPFIAENVRRLRKLGAIMVLGYPLFQLGMRLVSDWIITTRGPDVPSAAPDIGPFSWAALFGGLCVLVLAEVFAHGIRLREDLEGTI